MKEIQIRLRVAQLNTMQPTTKLIVINIFVWMAILGIGSQVGVYYLDKATAQQCRTHDWPKNADRIHKDWCVDNGYKI